MIERGGGYLLNTASAAGLLTQIGAAPYSVTKHAAVAFAEWLAITYGDRGIQVHCLAPMGVNTNLLNAGLDADSQSVNVVAAAGQILEPEEVAKDVMDAIEANRFMVLPHPEVAEFRRRKVDDTDRWLAGMRRLQGAVPGV
jgi:NAD(P)-dependent dehydrogenase (short-subunit alcohol dehydrogenase family)